MPDDPFAPADRSSRVRGVVCMSCGYDLSGLTQNDRCPECSQPVVLSARQPALALCPPELVRKVRVGLRLVFWGTILSIVLVPTTLGVAIEFAVVSLLLAVAISVLPVVILNGVGLFGWHLVTTQLPMLPDQKRCATIRFTLLAILVFSAGVSGVTGLLLPVGLASSNAALNFLAGVFLLIGLVCSVVVTFLQVAYLERLAAFTPDHKLERKFASLYIFLCIAVVLTAVTVAVIIGVGLILALASESDDAGGIGYSVGKTIGRLMGFGGWAGALVFLLIFLITLYKLGNRVSAAFVRAERRQNDLIFTASEARP